MGLNKKISVNALYTRSVNIERDVKNESLLQSYIPTARTKDLVSRIANVLHAQDGQRAFSLVGPYGSGKSSFSLFLSHLLSSEKSSEHREAIDILLADNVHSAHDIKSNIAGTEGYLKILISGSPEPFSKRLVKAINSSAQEHWASRKGRKPKLLDRLQEAAVGDKSFNIMELVSSLQTEISKLSGSKPKGMLFVIDEFGKFLEYEARHYGANDVFILQQLAELARKGNECNLFLFVLLHQSFEQYAKGAGDSLKKEWGKVQGRFEEVPFVESTEQTLRVVSKAITHEFDDGEHSLLTKQTSKATEVLNAEQALPSVLKPNDAAELFERCYPLHPVTALLLPQLCQKIAQNERTLFSFLGSHEPYGFNDLLTHMVAVGEYITPDVIFDYFVANQAGIVSDHITHRRWAEVVTAIERMGDTASQPQMALLKTIGLFNIMGGRGNFKASESILSTLYPTKKALKVDIAALSSKSVVTYRGFNNEYRVWQGSDFDLDDEIHHQLGLLGKFSLAEQLNNSEVLKPVVARKYTIEMGALRYYLPVFVDAATFRKAAAQSPDVPRIILFLAYDQEDEDLFESSAISAFEARDIVVLSKNSSQLRDAFSEVFALKRIEESSQALNEDPVAKREFTDRYAAAKNLANEIAKNCIAKPEDSDWYFKQKALTVNSSRELQSALSEAMEDIYQFSPIIHNELINKDKPSSQAAAGRRLLLQRLIENHDQELLGFPSDKFPPEKSMYLSLILQHGLHVSIKGKWALASPSKKSSLCSVWNRIEEFVSTTETKAKSFNELTPILHTAPYGVKTGVIPVLYICYYLVHQNELAWFEEGKFVPHLDIESAERFIKMPHLFSIQSFKIEGLKASLFDSYKTAMFKSDGVERTVMGIARPLTKFIGQLEEYTLKTTSEDLSKKARDLKKAFQLSKSPHKLLFVDLPKALGIKTEAMQSDDEKALANFSKVLTETLRELKYHYAKLLDSQEKLLCDAFNVDSNRELSEIRNELYARFNGLQDYTVEKDGLKAFILRLTNQADNDNVWLEGVLTFLASKPPKHWDDTAKSKADFRLSDYSKRVLELEIYKRTSEDNKGHVDGELDIILVKTLRKGIEPNQKAIAIDSKQKEAIQDVRKELDVMLESLQDDKLRLAVLADLVDDALAKASKSQ